MPDEVPSAMQNFSATRRERFGRLLRLAREVAGLVPREVGTPLGLTAQAVRNWEHDVRTPPRETLQAVEKLLAVTPGRLVSAVYPEIPCPRSVPAEEAVRAFDLDPTEIAATIAVIKAFVAGRSPYVEVWLVDNFSPLDMTPVESIQEDPRLTDSEKLRILGLVDEFVRSRRAGPAAVAP